MEFLTGSCKGSFRWHLLDTARLGSQDTLTYIFSAGAVELVHSESFLPSGIVVETKDIEQILEAPTKLVAMYTSNAIRRQMSNFALDDVFYHMSFCREIIFNSSHQFQNFCASLM